MHTTKAKPALTRLQNNPFDTALATLSGSALDTNGIRVSNIVQLPISRLAPNPISASFFREENSAALQRLVEDIAERGIIVPLIAKKDGTLLAGHNRLYAARELDFERVPVQFVEGELAQEEERRFVIADNLLRRQLTNEERLSLYRVLYDDFDARILATKQGRQPLAENRPEQLIQPLTVRQIAVETGQNQKIVRNDILQYKKDARASQAEVAIVGISKERTEEVRRAHKRNVRQLAHDGLANVIHEFEIGNFDAGFADEIAEALEVAARKLRRIVRKSADNTPT
jgi:ParB-like chromosome segregation protein Spo0J